MLWRLRDVVKAASWAVMCRTARHATVSGWQSRAYSVASRAYCWAVPVKGPRNV